MDPIRPTSLPLTRETSLYIDAVRVAAALIVFLGHLAKQQISAGLFWQVAPFGGDAVIVFFVISGFVIAHATAQSDRSAAVYAVNRAARIYSVAVPAILLTLVCDAVGRSIDPHYALWSYSPGASWQQLAASLTFTNEFWHAGYFPGSDGAYWSLGYEVPYYAMFGAMLFARGPWRIVLPLALLLLAGPGIAALLPIWLLGAGAYRLGRVWRPRAAAGWALFFGSFLLWAGAQLWLRAAGLPLAHIADQSYWPDYVTGLCFALNLIGFEAIAPRFAAVLRPCAGIIRWAAGRSFTIYLVHLPVLKLCAAMPFWNVSSAAARLTMIASVALVVLVIGHFFEQRREPWRRFFAALVPDRSLAFAAARISG